MRFKRIGILTPGQEVWGCYISGYTFCVSFNQYLGVYGASWKNDKYKGKQPANFIGSSIHPDMGLPYFKTMHEAEQACESTYKQLRQKQ